jgi:hypothetical protein
MFSFLNLQALLGVHDKKIFILKVRQSVRPMFHHQS